MHSLTLGAAGVKWRRWPQDGPSSNAVDGWRTVTGGVTFRQRQDGGTAEGVSMTAVVLVRGPDPGAISLHRCRLSERLAVRMCAGELDRRIAAGACPDDSAALSLRAHALIGAPSRRRLARALRQLVAEAREPFGPFHPAVPMARREIRDTEDLIEELADVLESRVPLAARGIARLSVLITDGGSPFYFQGRPGALRSALEVTLQTLVAPPAVTET